MEDIIENFDIQLNRLNNLGEKFNKFKTNNSLIKEKLSEINKKIINIKNSIVKLIEEKNNLEYQKNENTKTIQRLDEKNNELQVKINELEERLRRSSFQNIASEAANRGQEISSNNLNERIQELERINSELNTQIREKEEQLKTLAEENIRQAQEKQQETQQQIENLNKEKEQIETQLNNKLNELEQQNNELRSEIQKLNNKIDENNLLIDRLNKENELLENKIIQATEIIGNIMNLINDLQLENDPNEIQGIIGEIEKSIQELTNRLQNSRHIQILDSKEIEGTEENKGNEIVPSNTEITLRDNTGNNITLTLNQLKEQISIKARQIKNNPNNKYSEALREINKAKSIEEVIEAFNRNNLELKNGGVMGGKKTRKNIKKKRTIKKQKGGYIYEKSFKRKSISSILKSSQTKTSKRKKSLNKSSLKI